MNSCEMCGESSGTLYKVKVAGSMMEVCSKCKSKGKEVEEQNLSRSFYKKRTEDVDIEIVKNFASIVSREMAKRDINIHQLARTINIKESTLNKELSGKINPDISVIYKLEDFFNVKLTIEESNDDKKKSESLILEEMKRQDKEESNLNLADMIMKKMKEGNK